MGRTSVCAPEGCEAGRRASKLRFLLSVQINDLKSKSLICVPVHGRVDGQVKNPTTYVGAGTPNAQTYYGRASVWTPRLRP